MDEQIKTYIKLNMAHTKETCITPAVISRQLPKLYIGVSSSLSPRMEDPLTRKRQHLTILHCNVNLYRYQVF